MKRIIKNIITFASYFLPVIILVNQPALAQNKSKQISNSNMKIFVEYRLAKEGLLNDGNINVDVNNKTITLTGTVPTLSNKHEAALEAKDVNDCYNVVNNLTLTASNVPDSVVVKKVLKKIYNNPFYGVFNWVTASDSNGVVTLAGWVSSPWNKTQFQKQAEKVVGVKEVKNIIKNTFGPGELGFRVARLIYNDPLSMYNGMQYYSNPPIHIIVENGTVILAGHVSSNVEINWASNTIYFRTNAINVENYLTVNKNS